ncbi:MAG: hypothetical protein A2293_04010 [Elusimicrobia bacterium RIFOXYB2_FULL_49_7]|nr:MAG: hypothetical protein A2293_04010 [Elusimicrobia bacterium RIFOXYB2_FULL_49_7]
MRLLICVLQESTLLQLTYEYVMPQNQPSVNSVSSITKSDANPHSVEVFPSYVAKVSQAALYLKGGLALDQWADGIIDGSRNNHLTVIDCSNHITVLLSRRQRR